MILRVLVLSLVFLMTSAFLATASRYESVPARESLSELPLQIENWRAGDVSPLDKRIVSVLGVDDYVNRVYRTDDTGIGLYIGFYQNQREGSAIHSPMNCLPGAGWDPVDRRRINIQVRTGTGMRNIEVNRIMIQKGLDRQLVLYWYQAHGRIVASEYWGKIYTVVDTIRLNRTDAALVRVMIPISGSGAQAEHSVERAAVQFVQSLYPLLPRYLPE